MRTAFLRSQETLELSIFHTLPLWGLQVRRGVDRWWRDMERQAFTGVSDIRLTDCFTALSLGSIYHD